MKDQSHLDSKYHEHVKRTSIIKSGLTRIFSIKIYLAYIFFLNKNNFDNSKFSWLPNYFP